jgi:hypothetical protein
MRYVLSRFDYDDKDFDVVGQPDPLIVGKADLAIDIDEAPNVFPAL